MTAAVECAGVSRWFGESPALVAVSFSINAGERVALFGANGAGKTTLLRLLATLLTPSEGRIIIGGFDVEQAGARARSRLGFVGHEPGLYGDLTAEENLLFFAQLYGIHAARDRVRALLEATGLTRARRQRARTLSRGTRQRVALARALLPDPAILVLDEPDTGLDSEAKAFVEAVVSRPGTTSLFATHDRAWGETLATRVLELEDGRLVADRLPGAGEPNVVPIRVRRL
jgi:heme exporter protein A